MSKQMRIVLSSIAVISLSAMIGLTIWAICHAQISHTNLLRDEYNNEARTALYISIGQLVCTLIFGVDTIVARVLNRKKS